MPTPFSHLVAIARLLDDTAVPPGIRDILQAQKPAFVLGSVVADARVEADDSRVATHFYHYTEPYGQDPWKTMLDRYPQLCTPKDAAHRAFVAAYVAHLAMDQVWTENMLKPHFAGGDWGEDIRYRFFVLHTMLIDMDERDLKRMPEWIPRALQQAQPDDWLPFMPQSVVESWQSLMYDQIKPDGQSKTLEIFGERVSKAPEELGKLVHDDVWMQRELWNHIPYTVLEAVEAQMYHHARQSLIQYMQQSGEC